MAFSRVDCTRKVYAPPSSAELYSLKSVPSQMLYVGRMASRILLTHASNISCKESKLYLHNHKDLHTILFHALKDAITTILVGVRRGYICAQGILRGVARNTATRSIQWPA